MLALYVAHLPWTWLHKLLHRSTDNAVPVYHAMSPRLAEQLIWSQFVNVHGLPGKNIAADLHMEHLNRIAIKGLGTNKTEKAVMRVGRTISTIPPLLTNFDEENCIATPSGVHHAPGSEKDRNIVVSEHRKAKVFTLTTGQKHHFLIQKVCYIQRNLKSLLGQQISYLPD